MGTVDGCASRSHQPLALVSPQDQGDLLQHILRDPVPGEVGVDGAARARRDAGGLAVRLHRGGAGRLHRLRGHTPLRQRHPGEPRTPVRAGTFRREATERGLHPDQGAPQGRAEESRRLGHRPFQRLRLHNPVRNLQLGHILPPEGQGFLPHRIYLCDRHFRRHRSCRNRVRRLAFGQGLQG